MPRTVARLTTIAAVLVVTGCGAGSGKKSVSGLTSRDGAGQEVTARQGAFRTVVPAGYAYTQSVTQYRVAAPGEGGIYNVVLVVREPVRLGDMNVLSHRTLSAAKRQPHIHVISPLRRVSVDGEPALAVDYVEPAEGRETHVREVFVNHGGWVYIIQASSTATQFATNSGALEETIAHWRWQ